MEVVTIVGCVAAVITAFEDGALIVQQIKERRRIRTALQPPIFLEKSLQKGAQRVEQAKDDGIQMFGAEFEIGDKVATDALKDVIIELQGSLIKHLRRASEDDSMTDFTILVDASDYGRIKAVSILNDLYIRKKNAAPIALPVDYLDNPEKIDERPLHHGSSQSLNTPKGFDVTTTDFRYGSPSKDPSQRALSDQSTKAPETSTRPSKVKFWRLLSKSTPATGGSIESEPDHQNRGLDRSVLPNDSNLPSRPSSPMTASSQIPTDEANPWEKELSNSPKATSEVNRDGRRDSPVNSFESPRRPSTNESNHPAEEAYGGFCKGAYKLQFGFAKDGLKLRNSSRSPQGEGYYWACGSSKCAFEGPSCKVNKEWVFDDTIRHYGGVRYRWAFLAKSHVTLGKVKDRKYDYRCVFCVIQGQGSPVFRGAKVLMRHISQHRGEKFDEGILPKVKRITMREAADEEDFDINLTPADTEVSLGQAAESQPAYDDLGAWPTSEENILGSSHWRDLT